MKHLDKYPQITQSDFDNNFEDFMNVFRLVIDKHALLVKASRKQKRILQTKNVSIL